MKQICDESPGFNAGFQLFKFKGFQTFKPSPIFFRRLMRLIKGTFSTQNKCNFHCRRNFNQQRDNISCFFYETFMKAQLPFFQVQHWCWQDLLPNQVISSSCFLSISLCWNIKLSKICFQFPFFFSSELQFLHQDNVFYGSVALQCRPPASSYFPRNNDNAAL